MHFMNDMHCSCAEICRAFSGILQVQNPRGPGDEQMRRGNENALEIQLGMFVCLCVFGKFLTLQHKIIMLAEFLINRTD